MSFSHNVKEELSKQVGSSRHCQIAELAAMLNLAGQYGRNPNGTYTIGFQLENETVVRKGFTLLKKTYNINTVTAIEAEDMMSIYRQFGDFREVIDSSLIQKTCCQRAFLRGAFLCVGSISDPEKGYHLEFVCMEEEKAQHLKELIGSFGVEAKIVPRKKYHVVYIKEGAGIVDLLNVMEAHVAMMELENLRIVKEIANTTNRRVNCEMANISKTVNAAIRQIEDITFLRDHYGFQNLPDNLRQVAEMRLEYPEAPLKELGELMDPPVGKSGVNHRLRKLSELTQKLR